MLWMRFAGWGGDGGVCIAKNALSPASRLFGTTAEVTVGAAGLHVQSDVTGKK